MEEKKFILELIDLYRSLPALWDTKCKTYSIREIKNADYESLLVKYKEMYPEATMQELKQKINNLRSCYRREMKRIAALDRSRIGYSEDQVPTLFYYDAMSFLDDSEQQPCTSRNSIILSNENEADTCSSMSKYGQKEENEIPAKRKKKDASEELIIQATKRLMQPQDEFKHIAETWAIELKKMTEIQRIFAKKFIADIIFEGQMGTLHRNAMQLTVLSESNTTHTYMEDSIVPDILTSPSTSIIKEEYDCD